MFSDYFVKNSVKGSKGKCEPFICQLAEKDRRHLCDDLIRYCEELGTKFMQLALILKEARGNDSGGGSLETNKSKAIPPVEPDRTAKRNPTIVAPPVVYDHSSGKPGQQQQQQRTSLPMKLKITFEDYGTFYCSPASRLGGVKDEFSCRAWDGNGQEPLLYRLYEDGHRELYEDRLEDALSTLPDPWNLKFELSMNALENEEASKTDASTMNNIDSFNSITATHSNHPGHEKQGSGPPGSSMVTRSCKAQHQQQGSTMSTQPVPVTQTNNSKFSAPNQSDAMTKESDFVKVTLKGFEERKYRLTDKLLVVYQALLDLIPNNSADAPLLFRYLKSPTGTDIFRNHMNRLMKPIGELKGLDNLVFTLREESAQDPSQLSTQQKPIIGNEPPAREDPIISTAWTEFRQSIVSLYYEYLTDEFRGPFEMMVTFNDSSKPYAYSSQTFRAMTQCMLSMKPVASLFQPQSKLMEAIIQCDSPAHINDQWSDLNAHKFLYWLLHAWGFMRKGSHESYEIRELSIAFHEMNPDIQELTSQKNAVHRLFCSFIQQIHDVTELPGQNYRGKRSDVTDASTISMNVTKTCSTCGLEAESIDSKRLVNIHLEESRPLRVLMIPKWPLTKGGSVVNAPTKMNLSLLEQASIQNVIEMLQPTMPRVLCNEWKCYTRDTNRANMRAIPRDQRISQLDHNIEELYFYEVSDDPIEFVHIAQSDKILPFPPFPIKASLLQHARNSKNELLQDPAFQEYAKMISRFMNFEFNQSFNDAVKKFVYSDPNMILNLKIKSWNQRLFENQFWHSKNAPTSYLGNAVSLQLYQLLFDIIQLSNRSDSSDVFRCENCRQTRECVVRTKIVNPPELLMIHLQRWKANPRGFNRIDTQVECPMKMDLSAMVTNATDSIQYQLVAMVNDAFNNKAFAQCLRRCKNGESHWVSFESVFGRRIDAPQMQDATLLFYEKMMMQQHG